MRPSNADASNSSATIRSLNLEALAVSLLASKQPAPRVLIFRIPSNKLQFRHMTQEVHVPISERKICASAVAKEM